MSVSRTPGALVLDVESCNQLAGCPGCGGSHKATGAWWWRSSTRPRPGVPARFRWHNTALDMPRTHLPDGDIPGTRRAGVRTPGASGRPGDPLGDPTVALRRSHHRSWLDNWQPRGIPCGPTSSRACKPHLMTPPASQACGCRGSISMCGTTRTDADEGPVRACSYAYRTASSVSLSRSKCLRALA